MDNALYRIVEYPHAPVFDKSPQAVLALRLRHPAGLTWRVLNGTLTVTVGSVVTEYSLADYTIGQLADALLADGIDVPYENPAVTSRAAYLLLRGEKNQDETNGDHLTAYTSLMWCLYGAYGDELDEAERQVREALRQMIMTQAEGEWLDVWGTLYGISRPAGWSDAQYAPLIPEEAFRLRVNAHAIEKAILDATGWDVRIEEPWKELFTLDQSVLSGPDHLYDGERYGYHLIRPVTRDFVDWPSVLAVIERNRAAGVMVVGRIVYHATYTDASAGLLLAAKYVRLSKAFEPYEDRAILDYMLLDDEIIPNRASRRIRGYLHSSESAIPDGDYVVMTEHERTYRTYYSDVEYRYQFWTDAATWATANSDWTVDALITSKHTRS